MSPAGIRAMEIVGAIVAFAGIIYWYSTPGDVVVGPILVFLLGVAIAGIAWLIKRGQERGAVDDLVHQVRDQGEPDSR